MQHEQDTYVQRLKQRSVAFPFLEYSSITVFSAGVLCCVHVKGDSKKNPLHRSRAPDFFSLEIDAIKGDCD